MWHSSVRLQTHYIIECYFFNSPFWVVSQLLLPKTVNQIADWLGSIEKAFVMKPWTVNWVVDLK